MTANKKLYRKMCYFYKLKIIIYLKFVMKNSYFCEVLGASGTLLSKLSKITEGKYIDNRQCTYKKENNFNIH